MFRVSGLGVCYINICVAGLQMHAALQVEGAEPSKQS